MIDLAHKPIIDTLKSIPEMVFSTLVQYYLVNKLNDSDW